MAWVARVAAQYEDDRPKLLAKSVSLAGTTFLFEHRRALFELREIGRRALQRALALDDE
jgi:hypothetical protein